MWLICSTEISLYFNTIPEHIDAFVPSWHEFKNSIAVEIRSLHWQPFTNSHFHFFVFVELSTSKAQAKESMAVQGQKYRTVGLKDYRTLASD
jgi:hypothetical protein